MIDQIKSHLRDINLELLMSSPDIQIDISKRYYNKLRLFYPSRKLIKYITKIGGVLTGSRALRCYTISGKSILERKVNDWDFVVTLDMAYKICDDMAIDSIPNVGNVISVKNQRMWRHPDYEDSYRVGPVDVQLIIKDILPHYSEINGVRISNFGYSVSQKLEATTNLIGKNNFQNEYWKHISDLKEMIIKFNSIKNEK